MNYSELHYILCIAKHQKWRNEGSAGTLHFPAHTHQASAKTGTGNGSETLQPKWKNTYVPTYTGRKYMEYARKILQVKQDWEKELKDSYGK